MDITSELLGAYALGVVSGVERDAVRKYLVDNPAELETVAMMMDDDYDLGLDDVKTRSASMHSFYKELDTLLSEIESNESENDSSLINIMPLQAKAARNNDDNLCAIRCEGYALRTLGVNVTDDELKLVAEKRGLLTEDGIFLYNIGQLSLHYGLYVTREYHCSLDDIERALGNGDVVMAVIDNTELALDPHEADRLDRLFGELPNHALIIKSIDKNSNLVTLLNPGESDTQQDYPLEVFLEAWDDSVNYLIISNRNHYKPHPVDLSKITSEDNLIR